MFKRVPVYVIAVFVVLASLVHTPLAGTAPASETEPAQSNAQRTQMMQQSDYLRRLEQEREARTEYQDVEEVQLEVESQAAGLDYVVLVVLIASVVILILISTRKRFVRYRR
jgi:hypothetical protein